MRRIITLALFLSFCFAASASGNSLVVPSKKATEIMVPVGNTGKKISLMELSHMKVRDYEVMTGHKLKLVDKLGFKLAQRELKRSINPDGSFNQKRIDVLNKKLAQKPASSQGHHYLKLMIIFIILAVVLSIIGAFVPFMWILASLAWLGAVIFFILWLVNMSGAM